MNHCDSVFERVFFILEVEDSDEPGFDNQRHQQDDFRGFIGETLGQDEVLFCRFAGTDIIVSIFKDWRIKDF